MEGSREMGKAKYYVIRQAVTQAAIASGLDAVTAERLARESLDVIRKELGRASMKAIRRGNERMRKAMDKEATLAFAVEVGR